MNLHQTIKEQIKESLRAKDTLRLEVLRGLTSLFSNEILSGKATPVGEYLPDAVVLSLIKRSAKQRKDSIEQFEKGNRPDLASKEKAELGILESFLPTLMSRAEIHTIVRTRIDTLKAQGTTVDAKGSGKIVGMLIKELAGKADGADIKAVVDEVLKG
ncbi:MAG: GatB/YqeY domain-containing protein [Patescibacteria group bacterium]